VQRGTLVYRDVVSFVALDLILRIIRAGVVRVTLIIRVLLVHPDDYAGEVARFRVPAHALADLEDGGHRNNSCRKTRYGSPGQAVRPSTIASVAALSTEPAPASSRPCGIRCWRSQDAARHYRAGARNAKRTRTPWAGSSGRRTCFASGSRLKPERALN